MNQITECGTNGLAERLPSVPRQVNREDWLRHQVNSLNEQEGSRNLRDGVDCLTCRNTGYIYHLTEKGDVVVKECACMNRRRTMKKIRESGLEQVIWDYTFEDYLTPQDWQRELKAKAEAFCRDDNAKWFYVGGQVGVGKTHLCTAICADYIRRGYDTRYLLWTEQSRRLKATIGDYRAYAEEMYEYKRIPVLYIDDFLKTRQGTEPSDGDINLAFELINARLNQPDKITVISSEKTLKEALSYDEATISRIVHRCGKYFVNVEHDMSRNYRMVGEAV